MVDSLGSLIKLGKAEAQAGRYAEAIAAYEAAVELIQKRPPEVRKRLEWIWPTLSELYACVRQPRRCQALYQEHLVFLLQSGKIGKFRQAIEAFFDLEGVDSQIDLVSVFHQTDKLGIIHQLPQTMLDSLLSQAIEAYESEPDPHTYALISELVSRVRIAPPSTDDSLEARLMQPEGLMQTLEAMRDKVSPA